jgi:hypothetical protein
MSCMILCISWANAMILNLILYKHIFYFWVYSLLSIMYPYMYTQWKRMWKILWKWYDGSCEYWCFISYSLFLCFQKFPKANKNHFMIQQISACYFNLLVVSTAHIFIEALEQVSSWTHTMGRFDPWTSNDSFQSYLEGPIQHYLSPKMHHSCHFMIHTPELLASTYVIRN